MSLPPPPFWSWSTWSALWPKPPAAAPAAPLDISDAPEAFRRRWATVARVLALCNGAPGFHDPVPLSDARAVGRALDAWTESDAFNALMTWPPTRRAFRALLAKEFEQDPPTLVSLVMAIERPADAAAALHASAPHALAPVWRAVRAAQAHAIDTVSEQAVSSEPVAPASPPVAGSGPFADVAAPAPVPSSEPRLVGASEARRAPSGTSGTGKPKPTPSEAVLVLARDMAGWAERAAQQDEAVVREHINQAIKASIRTNKGVGASGANYWFEDIAFPALCQLPVDTARTVVRLWPQHSGVTFNDPQKAMGNATFWRAIRFTDRPLRTFLVTEALPALVDTSAWTADLRLALLDPLLGPAREPGRKWLFDERLALWRAWGGRLDEECAVPGAAPSESFLAPSKTTTARAWLLDQHVADWTQSLSSTFARESDPPAPPRRARP